MQKVEVKKRSGIVPIILFDSPVEAFVAIGLIVLAADGELSEAEAMLVYESMMSLDLFGGEAGLVARRALGELSMFRCCT